jgi:LysM repeat protein
VNLDGEVEEEPDEEGVSAGDSKEKLANILEKESVDTETQDDTALSKNLAEVLAQQVPSQKYTKGRMMPSVDRKGVLVTGEGIVQIEVKSPVDLQSIADASDVSYPLVKSLNPEIVRWCTPPDQKFYGIKLPMSAKEKFLQRYKSKDFQTKAEFATYRLKKGETLGRVANRNKLTAQPLVDLNGISEKKYLPAGSVVLLPIPKDPAGRSIAALDIVDKPSKSKRRRGLRRQKHKAEASRRTQRISVKLSRTISER